MIALWLLLALAFGQSDETPVEPPPVDDDVDASVEDGVLVVRVTAQALREARQKVIDDMARQGWTVSARRGDEVMFRGPENWMGRAILDASGMMRFTTPTASFQSVSGDDATAGSTTSPLGTQSPGGDYQGTSRDPGAAIVPQANFAIYPKKKAQIVHDRVLAEVGPELAAYRDVVQEVSFQTQLDGLAIRLDALWELGIPLEPGAPEIESIPERRRALLTYWATRAPTPQGEATCRAVEVWLSEIVQKSTDPVTAAEQEDANGRAEHGRRLALVTGPE